MVDGKKVLGVIGGMGPGATAYFMDLVVHMTEADVDQEHLDMIVYNFPSIPDRTGYIKDNTKPSPLEPMIRIGNLLAQQGADFLAIPCITAHYFYDELQKHVPIPIIHCIDETVRYLKDAGVERVGVMGTDGTISSGLFHRSLEAQGMTVLTPSAPRQKDVMHIIYDNIKATKPIDMDRFRGASGELFSSGAQAIILGCTELPLVKREHDIGAGFISVLEVLAYVSILRSGLKLKPEYRNLISK